MTTTQAIIKQDEFLSSALSVDAIVGQQKLVRDIMAKVMKKDQHFGVVPGCKKPSLWKPGAEVLCVTFRLSPEFTSEMTMDGKHMTVRSVCRLTHIPTGKVFGAGEALCTTREKKYRVRKDQGKIVENHDLEDCWNTVVKMANKRALVAAVLVVTGASEIFTQDMAEDEEPLIVVEAEATIKEAIKAEMPEKGGRDPEPEAAKEPEPTKEPEPKAVENSDIPKGKLTWTGKIARVDNLESNGYPVWELHGEDGIVFRTGEPKVVKEGVAKDSKYLVTYEVNGRKTKVALKLKELKA